MSSAPVTRIERYAGWLCAHPWMVIIATALIAFTLVSGGSRLKTTNDFRAFFGPDNPELVELELFEQTYERQQNILFVVIAEPNSVFTRDGLTLIHELTEMGWQIPYSRRVTSLTNHQHTRASDDELIVRALLDDPTELSDERIQSIRDFALGEESLLNRIISREGKATVINVALTLPLDKPDANTEVVAFASERVEKLRERFPDIEIAVGGTTATDIALGEAVARDITYLIVPAFLVIIICLLISLRHVGGTLATALVALPSIMITFGVFGWFGATLEATSGFVPSIVMTIAVADCVHILSTFYYELRRGQTRADAVIESLRINVGPVALTSITTTIGVLMLNFSDSPPYNELGNMIAIGVCAAWFLSMTFLPAALMLIPVRDPGKGKGLERAMDRFAEWLLRERKRVLVCSGVVIIVIAAWIPTNEIGEEWHAYFDETFAVQRSIDASAHYMGGLHILHYNLRTDIKHSINDPAYLADVEKLAQWLESQPEVVHVDRITELIARLNMNMHGDDPAMRRVPESRELAAQLLLLYELSLPIGMGLENTINIERSASRLTVSVKRSTSEEMLAFDARVVSWMQQNVSTFTAKPGTGVDLIFANINHRNIHSLLIGMVFALILISFVLIAALRSLKLGMLSLVTNLAPAGLAYGTWAMVNGMIDLSASVVIVMSIGIVVDDTVHFLSKYRRARREQNKSAEDALRYAFHTVGVALTITTFVLVAGFSVLTLSHFGPTVTTGALMAITMAFALLVDFLFLPPLLLSVDGNNSSSSDAPPLDAAHSGRT